jgi:murein L,D-transpeptidase YcbB/YkuD
VRQLRRRLAVEDEALGRPALPAPANPELFDEDLESRVREFQRRHSLDEDGAVGKLTLADLNVTAWKRVEQVEGTLARWRRGPRDEPPYRVEVNVPMMKAFVFRGGRPVLSLKTVVGSGRESPKWKGKSSKAETPEFEDEIETIEINPRWYIPEIIVRTELLAKEKQKPGFLDRGGYEWYNPRTGEHGPASQIPEADWSDPTKKLHLRQKAGIQNSLGRIKFVFHNQYAVYMHDTPEKHLFKRGRRNFSHGCVRVENPQVLAESLLAHSSKPPPMPLQSLLADTTRVVISLVPSVPIHLVYRTVWVEEDGTVMFLPDLYKWDEVLEKDLAEATAAFGGPLDRGASDSSGRAGPP